MLCVSSRPPMMMKARCTTTSASLNSSSSASRSSTSPWRYSVFFRPASAGSNGRRAIAKTRATSRLRSSARSSERPMSPVGPVMATVTFASLLDLRAAGMSSRLGPASPGHLALRRAPEAPGLLGGGSHELDPRLRDLEPADELVREQHPSILRLGEITADLEVTLPGELRAVLVGGQAGQPRLERDADGCALDSDPPRGRVDVDRNTDSEREPVGSD